MAIENLDAVGSALGLEPGKLAEMISSEENHNLELDNYVISTKENHDTLIENYKKEARQQGLEIAIKKKREELGLDFTGKKTLDPLLDAIIKKTEAEAKIEPNEKYDTLKSEFEKRGGLISEWENKFNDLQSTYKQKEQQRTIDNTLLKEIPDNTSIPKEDILAILKARMDFNIGEEGFEIIKNGEVQKNLSNRNLLTPKEFMTDFITPYLKTPDGGAGGGDSKSGGKESSLDVFNERMADKGVNVGSEQYNIEMSKAMKDGTLKF